VKRDVVKSIANIQKAIAEASKANKKKNIANDPKQIIKNIVELEFKMQKAADELNFELAIALRNQIDELKEMLNLLKKD